MSINNYDAVIRKEMIYFVLKLGKVKSYTAVCAVWFADNIYSTNFKNHDSGNGFILV